MTDGEPLATIAPDDWLERTALLDEVRGRMFRSRRATVFGRYVLLHPIGAGGSAAVYAAYDPELDRKVAIKLLQGSVAGGLRGSSATARARMIREAQALARLSHANVVAVHDVGTFDPDQIATEGANDREPGVFIVMDLIEGLDLAAWGAQPRPWREVVAVMIAAGRGLAAAHAAGLVHRDFKPANVLLARDGRVYVADFGLARPVSAPPEKGAAASTGASGQAELTDTGAVHGTPAYMAPEQHRGLPADARADQYAFCVTLWEHVHGTRPFVVRSVAELARLKHARELVRPLRGAPAWLDRVLARGMSPDPASRFHTMNALLEDLQRGLGRRVRAGVAAASTIALVAALTWVTMRSPLACDEDAGELAGTWDDSLRADIRASFLATGAPDAVTAWETLERGLDDYTVQWLTRRREACRAAMVDESRSITTMSRQMLCLDRQRARVASLTRLYSDADAQMLQQVAYAVAELPPIDECDAVDESARATAATRETVLAAETRAADVAALLYAGRIELAHAAARDAVTAAEQTADAEIIGEAALQLGRVERARGRGSAAAAALLTALERAELAGADALAVDALIELVLVTGRQLARPDEATAYARIAAARIERRGLGPRRSAALAHNLGRTLEAAGRPAEALRSLEHALALAERAPGSVAHADVLVALTMVHSNLGFHRRALELGRRALAMRIAIHGDRHPNVAASRAHVGAALIELGEVEAGSRELEDALAVFQDSIGESPAIAFHLAALAGAESTRGRHQRALELQQRAYEIAARVSGVEHPWTAHKLAGLATVHLAAGRTDEALALARRAWAAFDRHPASPFRLLAAVTLARVLQAHGRHAEALAICEDGMAVPGPDDPNAAIASVVAAESLLASGRAAEATTTLAHALEVLGDAGGSWAAQDRARALLAAAALAGAADSRLSRH